MKSAVDVALGFVDRINRHDLGGLVALMTEDHRFVDGLGQELRGRKQMEKGWLGYFAWFPDYCIRVDDAMSNGNVVAMFGSAQGTYSGKGNLLTEANWEIRRHGRRWCAMSTSLSGGSMLITNRSGRSWE